MWLSVYGYRKGGQRNEAQATAGATSKWRLARAAAGTAATRGTIFGVEHRHGDAQADKPGRTARCETPCHEPDSGIADQIEANRTPPHMRGMGQSAG